MNYRLKIIFSDQPAIDESITINAQFIETFKASRINPGEVAIGAILSDTIINLQNALIEDYQGLFPFTSSVEGDTLILNFIDYNETFFDLSTTSNVITFELVTGYFPYFTSNYDNKVDNFKLIISGDDPTFTPENISATAVLSYKDVDNILSPIRGKQLEIEIDANIDKPYDLFLDFREKDFKVLFFRNEILIFEGFVNAEGVTQSYTSINWRAKLVAVDNIGALKNTEFQYNNELPSEFVFMDKCLKQTGLDLPIAFFDDINKETYQNNVKTNYGATLDEGIKERIIEPEVFINKNDTFQDCETILKDILQKYNAIILQENIRYYDDSNEEFENRLCWLFLRIPLLKVPFSDSFRPYKIKYINNYFNSQTYKDIFKNQDLVTPNIITIGTFSTPFYLLATDGETFLGTPDVIHKNKNQLLRQTRALQNFRFEHLWISKGSILENFGYDIFELLNIPLTDDYFFNFVSLNIPQWIGYPIIQTNTFDPTIPIESQALGSGKFVKLPTIEVPDEASAYKISGNGSFFNLNQNNFTIFGGIHFMVIHTDLNGNRYYLQSPPSSDGVYTINQLFIPSESTFDQAVWVKDDEIQADESGNLSILNVSNILFSYFGNNEALGNFDITFPDTLESGGTIDVYFSPLFIRNTLLNPVSQQIAETFRFSMVDFNFEIIKPPELGEGEYHDAKNLQNVSSKVDDPVKVINADENTNIFLNGLKRIVNNEIVNYDYWTSYFNLQQNRENLLELTSIERVKLFSKSQNIFSGDIHGYVPFYARLANTAYKNAFTMAFTKWVYDTNENTISAEMMENDIKNPSVDYEKTFIFEDEDKKLIE